MTQIDHPSKLANGAEILAHSAVIPAGHGMLTHCIVLAYWAQSLHPFVTWQAGLYEDGWHAGSGNYFTDLAEANADFLDRAKREARELDWTATVLGRTEVA